MVQHLHDVIGINFWHPVGRLSGTGKKRMCRSLLLQKLDAGLFLIIRIKLSCLVGFILVDDYLRSAMSALVPLPLTHWQGVHFAIR